MSPFTVSLTSMPRCSLPIEFYRFVRHDGLSRGRIAPLILTMKLSELVQGGGPNTSAVPAAKVILNGFPCWIIVGEHPPRNTIFNDVENRIHVSFL